MEEIHTHKTSYKKYINTWFLLSAIIVFIVFIPILQSFRGITSLGSDTLTHLYETILLDVTKNTLFLLIISGIITILIGVTSAWFVTAIEFPGRNFFKWGLTLPLTIPTYIAGFVYGDIFSYTGSFLAILTRVSEYLPHLEWLTKKAQKIDIMTLWGGAIIFGFFLYPYIFIVMRAYFAKFPQGIIDSSKVLGRGSLYTFFRVILPMSRVAIVSGVTLVSLEILNAHGLVDYFGIKTFSSVIVKARGGLNDTASSLSISFFLLIFVFTIITAERLLRGRKRFGSSTTTVKPIIPKKVSSFYKVFAFIFCSIVISIGFFIPLLQLIFWALKTYEFFDYRELLGITAKSIKLSVISALVIISFALIVSNTTRVFKGRAINFLSQSINFGYAIPGAVIGIGVLTTLLDLKFLFNTQKLLTLTVIPMVIAYTIRFLAVAYNTISSGFNRVGIEYHNTSRVLGYGITKTFFKVDLPLIIPSVVGAFILSFIEVIKELPITKLLHPFNYNTLSIKIFQYAGDEQIQRSAIPSLVLISIAGIAIIIFNNLHKIKFRSKNNDK